MFKDLFAGIYETVFGIFESKYSLIFTTLYDLGGYTKLGLLFILVPLLCWLLFYYAWKYPYGRFRHWGLLLIITALVVFGFSWSVANTEIFASDNQQLTDALNDPESGYMQYASDLPVMYATINTALAVVLSFVYSLILKQFSRIQLHLPF